MACDGEAGGLQGSSRRRIPRERDPCSRAKRESLLAGKYCLTVLGFLRSLNPRLPRSVQMLQLGGLVSAFGNGLLIPFLFLYLHNVRGIGLGVAGLIVATNALVSIVAGPVSGPLVDRYGGRAVLTLALVVSAAAFACFAFVHEPWQGFLVAAAAGVGTGFFWPAQSTLLASLSPPDRRHATFAMQRVMMNLGIGLGALTGGLIADVGRPGTFVALFVIDGLTFLVYLAFLFAAVPGREVAPPRRTAPGTRAGSYGDVVRHRPFMAVVGLNTLFIFAGMSGFELLPVFAKNEAGVSESAIGAIFFVNTVVIVLTQLPIAKLSEGHRRMRMLAALGLLWAGCWVAVSIVGTSLDGRSAAILLAVVLGVFGIGECIHGAVQAPLVTDLAEPQLLGRYMALSALSWQVGFTLGPAIGGFLLAVSPGGTWLVWAAMCVVGAGLSLALEPRIPSAARRTPVAQPA
jgi:MFS family permease